MTCKYSKILLVVSFVVGFIIKDHAPGLHFLLPIIIWSLFLSLIVSSACVLSELTKSEN